MEANKRYKFIQECLERRTWEEAQKIIIVLNTTSGEELIALGVTNRITLLVVARRMSTKHNLLYNALARIEIMHQGFDKFNKLF